MAADGHAPAFVPVEALTGRARNGARRSITINASRASKGELMRLQMQRNGETIAEYDRPQTRGDCLPGGCNGARPCPWVSCKAHLAIDVDERTGSIKVNFPELDVLEMAETCALDVADRGGITLEEVGAVMNLVRERVRQLEVRALAGVAQASVLLEYLDAPPTIHRAPPVPTKVSRLGRPRLQPGDGFQGVLRAAGMPLKQLWLNECDLLDGEEGLAEALLLLQVLLLTTQLSLTAETL
jgi:hypothetical protein